MSGGTSSPAPRPSITFEGVAFVASRREVLPLLTRIIERNCGGWFVEFYGTAEELVAAGVATPDLFEIGKSGQRTHQSEFGDLYLVKRVRGKWSLEITVGEEAPWPSDSTLDPHCIGYQKVYDRRRWLKQGGAQAEATTAAILKRFAQAGRP